LAPALLDLLDELRVLEEDLQRGEDGSGIAVALSRRLRFPGGRTDLSKLVNEVVSSRHHHGFGGFREGRGDVLTVPAHVGLGKRRTRRNASDGFVREDRGVELGTVGSRANGAGTRHGYVTLRAGREPRTKPSPFRWTS